MVLAAILGYAMKKSFLGLKIVKKFILEVFLPKKPKSVVFH